MSRLYCPLEPPGAPAPRAHQLPSLAPSVPARPSAFAASLDFSPDPAQSAVLDHPARNLILCCTRQWGKSTVAALKALHFALSHPATTTLVAAPSLRQSAEFVAKCADFLAMLKIAKRTDRRNAHSILLPNRARLVALPANQATTRGFSPSLLLIDEAAYVPDAFIHALLPSLAATAGALWLLSTPNGQSGFFYDAWHSSAQDLSWSRFQVAATDCPRILPEFLNQQRLLLGEMKFKSEFLCEFTAAPGQLFPRELFECAINPDAKPWELNW